MRLRQSNRAKRFGPSDLDLHLDSSGDEQSPAARRARESSEDEFVVDGPDAEAHNGFDDDDGDGDGDEADFDPQPSSGIDTPRERETIKSSPKRPRKRGPPLNLEGNLGEVLPYPTDPGQRYTRTYIGPLKRWARPGALIESFGDDYESPGRIFDNFFRLWWQQENIPPRIHSKTQLAKAEKAWMPADFTDNEDARFDRWYPRLVEANGSRQKISLISRTSASRWFLPDAAGELTAVLGHVSNQKEYKVVQGDSIAISSIGNPLDTSNNEDAESGGWVLDVGGIVGSMGWAPAKGEIDQLLALAVIPFADQAFYRDMSKAPKESEKKEAAVQIWRFDSEKGRRGSIRPARSPPKLVHTFCFSWGRIARMQWCPFSLRGVNRENLLAILCSDGRLRLLRLPWSFDQDSEATFEEVQEPLVTICPPKEHTIDITCFTWINMNRMATGLSDGSVAVWSVHPLRCLQRHPVHLSAIMEIVSGYPSDPFIVATIPAGGIATVTDLSRPNAEVTYQPNLLISLQPNLLSWSRHMRGWTMPWPSTFPGNPNISFLQARNFPLGRHVCTVNGQPTCVSVGTCHPFALVGASNGSVWAFNMMRKIFIYRKPTYKMKLFQHEFLGPEDEPEQAAETVSRGTCRILHGFVPEPNTHPIANRIQNQTQAKRAKQKSGRPAKHKGKKKATAVQDDTHADEDEANMTGSRGPIIVNDPQTRITAVAWNPNPQYSWWAAAAMASGLVRIMDLGVEGADVADDENYDLGDEDMAGHFSMEDTDEDGDEDVDVDMDSWM
ncbi:WD40-repeat-containing domain protein [Xylariaceae sp. FL0016]|nr:WD40-repeat-containing domain protein [Xylariaceae sp. FL0016]